MLGTLSLEDRLKREVLIAKGQTSDVFSWGREWVLKLNFSWLPAETARREFVITGAVHRAGLRVPAALDVIEVDGRHGIIFERVQGHSLLRQVEKRPWTLFSAARQLAELHAGIHACPAPPDLPSQRQQIERWISHAVGVSEDEKEMARSRLPQLEAGDCVCHGDFHPANVLLTPHDTFIIDWSTGTRGHALADVARTSVLFERASLPEDASLCVRILMRLARRVLHDSYLKRYLELRPASMEEIEFWRVPQRIARLGWLAQRSAAINASQQTAA